MDTSDSRTSGIKTLLFVGIVSVCAAAIVTASYQFSKDRIIANERARLLRSLNSVLDPAVAERIPNPVRLGVEDPLLGSDDPVDVFVALEDDRAVATIFASVAPDGYNAPIQLLIGVAPDGEVTGVRALGHRETPGLGDAIEVAKSDWIRQFEGTSLDSPPLEQWAVTRDEGAFDTITGATVTSRAVVDAVENTLRYYEQHEEDLLAAAREASEQDEPDAAEIVP